MKRILQNGTNLLFQEQKTILSGAAVIGSMIFASNLLGLIKMRLYAGVLGVGTEFDIFVAAFKIPDFIFQLVVAGSLNAAFIPIFSELITQSDRKTAWRFVSNILNLSLLFFLSAAAIIWVLAKPLSWLVAVGFSSAQTERMVELMRIMLLSPILLGISSFAAGSIQSFRRFFIPFLSPILYNLGAIFGILFLYHPLGLSGLAWGVVLGALLHLLVVLPVLRHLGFQPMPVFEAKDPQVLRLLRLSFPRTVGLAAEQIKMVLLTSLASLLGSGAISVLRFGESIAVVPVAIFGVAIGQAALPTLSQLALTDLAKFKRTLLSSLFEILYLTVPVSVILIVLKIPMVRLILGIGRFDWEATVTTSWVVALLALSIAASAGSNLLIRAFYALQETRLPVLVGIVSVATTLFLAILLLFRFEIKGLAFATAAGGVVEMLLLCFFLTRRLKFTLAELLIPSLRIFLSALFMAATIYIPVHVLDRVFLDTRKVVNLLILVWLVLTLGGTTYLLSTWILGCPEIRLFIRILIRLRDFRESLISLRRVFPQAPPAV